MTEQEGKQKDTREWKVGEDGRKFAVGDDGRTWFLDEEGREYWELKTTAQEEVVRIYIPDEIGVQLVADLLKLQVEEIEEKARAEGKTFAEAVEDYIASKKRDKS